MEIKMNQSENMNTSAQETKEYEQRSTKEVKKDMEATYSGKKCSEEGDRTAEEKRASGDTQIPEKYRARSEEEVKADMERTYTSKNCTEEGDCTAKDKRDYKEAPDIAELMKILKNAIPDLPSIVQTFIQTGRQEGKVVYSDRAIVLTAVFGFVCGVDSARMVTELFNTDEAIENLGKFVEQKGLGSIPNYSTIKNALEEIKSCPEAFNEVLKAMVMKLLESRRYDSERPLLAYMTMEKDEEGNFIPKVNRLLPIIGDGTETHRQNKPMSPQDLVCVKRDKDNKDVVLRVEYFHKFETLGVLLADNLFVPLWAYPIENEEGYDFVNMCNQDTEKVKQACELNEGKKAIGELNQAFAGRTLLYQFDGLYLAKSVLDPILASGNCYCITFKEGCAPALYDVAVQELERQVAEFNAGNTRENPYKNFGTPGGLHGKVACIENIGGLSGDPGWEKYPMNFIRAELDENKVIYDETSALKITGNRGRKEAKERNEKQPLEDFTREECEKLLKDYTVSFSSMLSQIPFDELIKDVVFVQTRDPRTGYRIVEVIFHRTFTWVTNIILDLNNHEEIKKLLTDQLLNGAAAKKSDGHRLQRKNYIKNYMLNVVNQARKRWVIEEFFNILKNGNMKIEKRKSRSYAAEKAYFYIALMAQFILALYRKYDKYAARSLKTFKMISLSLLASFRQAKLADYKEHYTKRICLRDQLAG